MLLPRMKHPQAVMEGKPYPIKGAIVLKQCFVVWYRPKILKAEILSGAKKIDR